MGKKLWVRFYLTFILVLSFAWVGIWIGLDWSYEVSAETAQLSPLLKEELSKREKPLEKIRVRHSMAKCTFTGKCLQLE